MTSSSSIDLSDQVAVVTGGSGVLGRVMAAALAGAGARVAILSRRPEACERVAQELRAAGGQALGLACDVESQADLARAAAQAEAALGPVDILINAAGGNQPGGTTSLTQTFF